MALSINTNMMSLNAQKNLRQTEAPLQKAMERLSTGLRINSASDDAAGLAIATRMSRQINGLNVAMRNANDGISFAQTAEGAMDEMITAVQRIYELAEQSASYNTSADRSSMNTEVQELISELSRIVSQTRYNGELFLNQQKSIDIQVGVEVKETINISTSNVSPDTMGVATSYSSTLTAANVASASAMSYLSAGLGASATLAGVDLGDAVTTATAYQNNSLNLINRINTYSGDTGATAFSFGNSLVGGSAALTATTGNSGSSNDTSVAAGFLTINGVQIGSFAASVDSSTAAASTTLTNMLSAINNKSATTGVTAYFVDKGTVATSSTANASSVLVLANTDGAAIDVTLNTAVAGGSLISNTLASSTMSVSAGQNGKIIFNAGFTKTSLSFDGTATGAVFGVGTASSSVSLTATSLNNISTTSVANANVAILAAKESLESFITEKAKLGAKLNRLDSTIRNIESTRENITAAKSRIMDADFATETANMTRSLILQQAGISVLAQANQVPNNVLALLQ
ncbi:MAG TPA: flagellin [Gammaproteobacteria bacterium]|nr:flagellin [Gammaproteobacteria bacterium]